MAFSVQVLIALPLPQYLPSTLQSHILSGADSLVLHNTAFCAESLDYFVALGQR